MFCYLMLCSLGNENLVECGPTGSRDHPSDGVRSDGGAAVPPACGGPTLPISRWRAEPGVALPPGPVHQRTADQGLGGDCKPCTAGRVRVQRLPPPLPALQLPPGQESHHRLCPGRAQARAWQQRLGGVQGVRGGVRQPGPWRRGPRPLVCALLHHPTSLTKKQVLHLSGCSPRVAAFPETGLTCAREPGLPGCVSGTLAGGPHHRVSFPAHPRPRLPAPATPPTATGLCHQHTPR